MADITTFELKPKSFDAVIATQVLEHLTKEQGFDLFRKMDKMARKKVIITVPNGHVYQDDVDGNPFQRHKSAWNASELESLGFRVYGMSGWKVLRGYRGEVKYRPRFIWRRISDFTQILTYHFPQCAFQIFAVKTMDDSALGET